MSQRWNRHHFHLQKHSQWRQGSSTRRLRSFLTRCSLQNFKIELLFSKLLLLCISSNSGAACSRKALAEMCINSTLEIIVGKEGVLAEAEMVRILPELCRQVQYVNYLVLSSVLRENFHFNISVGNGSIYERW
ncbi:uncharacterized protein [Arachis hypogaea]|uniref:uncharacterized protein n=1 Tax=Arachis hypogaea TaxID=3818 RepID=UPI003B21ABA6